MSNKICNPLALHNVQVQQQEVWRKYRIT